jgi:lysyl-tRNA synthetase, class II
MGTFEEIVENNLKLVSEIRSLGMLPYGGKFERTGLINDFLQSYEEGKKIRICGRITAVRDHGKTKFLDLTDFSGRIQLYFKKDLYQENQFELVKRFSVGDFIGVDGELLKTRTGEITVKVEGFVLLSKAIRPLPEKWHGLKDVEARYRQRYLDLIANSEVKEVFLKRIKIINAVRTFLNDRGFLEVETPMMQSLAGGAVARPFVTHHNALDIDLYLRVAPELYLKRLLVGGFEKIYELNRNFRNEGLSKKHNPEFTMLEIYAAYEDYRGMMDLCENIIKDAAKSISLSGKVTFNGKEVDVLAGWEKITYMDALSKYAGITEGISDNELKKTAEGLGVENIAKKGRFDLLNDIFEIKVEDKIVQPTFITDYPKALCPLAKTRPDNPDFTERFELIIGGSEVANAYSELNDPVEQKERFEKQVASLEQDVLGKKEVDYDYVHALEYGMPSAGGLGIGIDRLVMLLTSSESIKDVILFPQLRPGSEQ